MAKIKLGDICHSRAGDKGDVSNIGLVVYDPANYEVVRQKVTAELVKEYFRAMVQGDIVRYELPQLGALNFVMQRALDGGSSRSRRLDALGKTLSSILLDLEIEVP